MRVKEEVHEHDAEGRGGVHAIDEEERPDNHGEDWEEGYRVEG